MNSKYSYTLEKLDVAIEILATDGEDVKARLLNAFISSLVRLDKNNFPIEMQKDWVWIHKQLTKFGPLVNHKGEVWRG